MRKTSLLGLAFAAVLGTGIYALISDDADEPPPPARVIASDNPAVAGAAAPGSTWGRDVLKAPPRIVALPTQPALPARVAVLPNQRTLPVPPEETTAPASGPP